MKKLKLILCAILLAFPMLLSHPQKSRLHSGYTLYPHELERERECIANALWFEARGEGEEGMRAVLSVIQNRKNNSKFPNTYCGVIYQPKQFSFIINGESPNKTVTSSEKEVEKKVNKLAYKVVYADFKNSFDNPDVMWYAHKNINNKWTKVKSKIITIGNHSFYAYNTKRT